MGLTSLPVELLVQVATDPALSTDDVRALRLVARSLAPIGASILFRRIYLSKFNRDREAFLGIAGSPHLARLPAELVWYELGDDKDGVAEGVGTEEDSWTTLPDAVSNAIWLPVSRPEAGRTACPAEREAAAAFLPLFLAALDAMPALHTFVSRPFPCRRLLSTQSWFELPAYLLRASTSATVLYPANTGLMLFLLPAMARPESRVTRLYWADELPWPSFLRLDEPHVDAFRALTAIDLCISHPQTPQPYSARGPDGNSPLPVPAESVDRLAACVRRAADLRTLSLCFEKGSDSDGGAAKSSLVDAVLFRGQPRWRNLTSLCVTDAQLSGKDFLAFLASHSAGLRHLGLTDCDITRSTVVSMAELPLRLSSFAVGTAMDVDEIEVVSEEALLDFVNKKTADCPVVGRGYFRTSAFLVWDPHEWTAVTHFDMEAGCRPLYDGAAVSLVQQWADSLETAESAGPDTEGWGPDSDEAAPAEVREVNGRAFNQNVLKFTPAEVWAADLRQRERRCGGPRWKWARSGTETVYWQTQDETGHATSTWRFTREHADGTTSEACGSEPLEYWSDWDSVAGETGDVMAAEPTPYGRDFALFILGVEEGFEMDEDVETRGHEENLSQFNHWEYDDAEDEVEGPAAN